MSSQTKSTDKLSDRIAHSVKKFVKLHVQKSEFTRFLLTGEDINANDIFNKMWKKVCDIKDSWFLLFENGLKKAESDDEINTYKQLLEEAKQMDCKKHQLFRSKFGSLSDDVMSSLVSRETWLLSQYLTKEAIDGSINELIIITYTIIMIRCEQSKLKKSPKYKPNPYFDFWHSEDKLLLHFHTAFKHLIDAKQSQITAEEEKHLIDLMKKTIAFGYICFNIAWNKNRVIRANSCD